MWYLNAKTSTVQYSMWFLCLQDRQIYYGLGEQTGWRYITRNVLIDLHKGAAASSSLRKKFKKVVVIVVKVVE